MKNFVLYTQHDQKDCGVTCLRMVAAHFGRKYSLEFLRTRSRISRVGVSMLGISEGAESIGLRTTGARLTFERLTQAPLPCIIYWKQNHFVIVYCIRQTKKNTYVYVADPSKGKIKYTKDEFCSGWINNKREGKDEGVVLLIFPTPDFYELPEEQKQQKSVTFILAYLKPYRQLIIQLIMGLTFGSILQLIFPFLTQSVVDIGIQQQDIPFIYLILLAQLMLTLSSASIEFMRGWILLHIGARINVALIADFLLKLMKLPIGYFDTKMTGDLLQRIGDHNRIQEYLTSSSLNILFSMVNALIFSAILAMYNIKIFFIFVVGSVMYVIWVQLFMKKREEIDRKNFALQAANQGTLVQLITGMQEIQLNTCEQQKRWEWETIQARLFDLHTKSLALGQYQDSGAIVINQIKNILITIMVAQLVVQGQMTLGMMLAVQYIIGQLNGPIDQIMHFLRQTQDAHLSLERLREIHNKEDEEMENATKQQIIPEKKPIILKDLSFAYNQTSVGKTVLDHIDLTIPAYKQTAIVGMSGSGKTTLLKLILGFYSPKSGSIYLDDKLLNSYSWRQWRKRCGVVMQDSFIFSDTIARNIAPGVENIDKNKLLSAVTTANIRDYIESLPLSYNTMIGSDGNGLSQGQKQRILIARAVYKEPEYVFFDEATNALDTHNEQTIMNNLQTFFQGKTVVVVAHRLSTVRHADQIVVMDQGCIKEIGTHEDLIANEDTYYRLVKNQLQL